MTGFECVSVAIQRFEAELSSQRALSIRCAGELAETAGYSAHHFTRLFYAVTGLAPKDYISSRILSVAAVAIATEGEPLASIAERLGYRDYETFSRAFKRRFEHAPSHFRSLRRLPEGISVPTIPQKLGERAAMAGAEPDIVTLESFSITGLPFHIHEGTLSFHREWTTFMSMESLVTSQRESASFYQFSAWNDALSGLSILCGLETEAGSEQESVFTTRTVPEATYLRFIHRGSPATLFETYTWIYQVYLSSHTEKPAAHWEFQRYPDSGTTEIFIPIALGERQNRNSPSQSKSPLSSMESGQCAHQEGTEGFSTRSLLG